MRLNVLSLKKATTTLHLQERPPVSHQNGIVLTNTLLPGRDGKHRGKWVAKGRSPSKRKFLGNWNATWRFLTEKGSVSDDRVGG